jgi:hypothetical protein
MAQLHLPVDLLGLALREAAIHDLQRDTHAPDAPAPQPSLSGLPRVLVLKIRLKRLGNIFYFLKEEVEILHAAEMKDCRMLRASWWSGWTTWRRRCLRRHWRCSTSRSATYAPTSQSRWAWTLQHIGDLGLCSLVD